MAKIKPIKISDVVQKNVISFREAVILTGFKTSYLYKLTHSGKIPYSKPTGKLIYFDRAELETFLLSNRQNTDLQNEQEAITFNAAKRKVR